MAVTSGMRLGRYRLSRRIGSGGMAEVWEAFDEGLQRTVAVKVIAEMVSREPSFTERFIREARIVAGLEHPNILPIYDFGQEGETVYLVMPLVPGGNLRDRMTGPVPGFTTCGWISATASALDHAHTLGILHRDVKPANVLMDKRERPLLSDFGLAKSAGASFAGLTATGAVLGTPTYMSPEQALGETLDGRSDQYSLGVIAFQLLTGAVPFQADSPLVILRKHLQESPPPASRVNPRVSAAVDSVMARVLSKAPMDRYPTCEEFASALEKAVQAGSESATLILEPPAVSPPTLRTDRGPAEALPEAVPTKRHRLRVALLWAGGVVLLAFAVAAIQYWLSLGKAEGIRAGAAPPPSSARARPSSPRVSPSAVAAAVPQPLLPPGPALTAAASKPVETAVATPAETPLGRPTSEALAAPTRRSTPRPSPRPAVRPSPTWTAPPASTPPPEPERRGRVSPSADLWQNQREAGQKAFRSGDYRGAERSFRGALAEAERFGEKDSRLARSLGDLGIILGDLNRYAEAEALLRRSLAIEQKRPGAGQTEVADALQHLAWVLGRQRRYDEAEAMYRRALELREKSVGREHRSVASTVDGIAWCYTMRRDYAAAEPLYRRALEILARSPQIEDRPLANVLNDFGRNLLALRKYAEAERMLERSLSLREKLLGPGHPDIAQAAQNLANAEIGLKKYGPAEPLLRRALQIRERSLGPDHPFVASTLSDLARLLQLTGRSREAAPLLERARAIRRKNRSAD